MEDKIIKHGPKKTKEYETWIQMKSRCNNPKHKQYSYYGGRGIGISVEWASFEAFYRDMGKAPTKTHTIDRIDNNGHYCKDNCRWATKKEQARNRGNSSYISFRGQTKTIAEWAEALGMSDATLRCRIKKMKWPIEDALTISNKTRNGHKRKFNQYHTIQKVNAPKQ